MAAYFTSSQYASYLPDEIGSSDDVGDLASRAEWKVINHYTRRVRDTRGTVREGSIVDGYENLQPLDSDVRVYLLHYETDADDVDTSNADEAAFLEAMRRAIAFQIEREYYVSQQNPTLKSHTRGQRSWTYSDTYSRESLDPRVESALKPFDLRPVTYAI